MIDLEDFVIKKTLRKTPRYKGETNNSKYYRCTCGICGKDRGYQSKSRYKNKKNCVKCTTNTKKHRDILVQNHWSKNGGKSWNKGTACPINAFNNRLKTNLRSRLNKALKNNYKTGSAVSDLGCSIEELKTHLELQFQKDMSWDNYGKKGWHIDHIKPLARYDLTNREELIKACHYSNLQPLWAKDNLKKSSKY